MAWPGSRFTSFVPNNVPVISASYINAQQDWTAAITNDTVSVVGLQVDGVGGQAKVAVPGAVKWTNSTGGANPPRTTGLTNEARALNTCKLWGRFRNDAGAVAMLDGANIFGASHVLGTNRIVVTIVDDMADANYSVVASAMQETGFAPGAVGMVTANDPNAGHRPAVGSFHLHFAENPLLVNFECCFELFGRQNS